MTKGRRVAYKKWAGITISGETKWQPSTVKKENHLDKATWLTSAVEGGAKFGTVQSYDGAGMSAGIEHQIAVLPRSLEQGDLWKLLSALEMAVPANNPNMVAFKAAIDHTGWYIDTQCVLRHKHDGSVVGGAEIREEFAPPGGVVPESGPDFDKAMVWANLFNKLFEDPATFPIQIREAKNDLLNGCKDVESQVYSRYCHIQDASAAVLGKNISPELDIAMCVYHSFSVNAPSKARTVLQTVLAKNLGPVDFAKELVKGLGTNDYANWQERYVRTRNEAKNSGLFDQGLFTSIVPQNL